MMADGTIQPLPAKTRKVISGVLPDVPIPLIESAFVHYQMLTRDHSEPPKSVRAALEKVSERAGALYELLGSLSEEAREHLRARFAPAGGAAFLEQADFVTQALMGGARNAVLDVSRRPTWKHALVCSLANILEAHGRTADAKPNGDLCFLTLELLTAFGDTPGDVRSTVRDGLAKRGSD